MKQKTTPTFSNDIKQANRIRLAIGICFLVIAAVDLLRGQPSMTSMRWQWLYQIISTFGPYAITFVEAAVGVIFIIWSL